MKLMHSSVAIDRKPKVWRPDDANNETDYPYVYILKNPVCSRRINWKTLQLMKLNKA